MSFDLPEDLIPPDVNHVQGVAICDVDTGELTPARAIIWEFSNHDEWKAFQKNRKLILIFPFGDIQPILLEAFRTREEQVFESTTVPNDQN